MSRLFSGKIFVLTLFFLLLEVVFLPYLNFGGYAPSPLLILVVFYAFYINWEKVPQYAILVGFLKEIFSSSMFGLQIVSFCLGALILRFLLRKVERENIAMQLAATFFFSLCVLSIFNLGLLKGNLFLCDWLKIFVVSIFNTVLSFFVFIWFGHKIRVRDQQYELFG